jgi:hypothetical protein
MAGSDSNTDTRANGSSADPSTDRSAGLPVGSPVGPPVGRPRSGGRRLWIVVRRLALAAILIVVGHYVWRHLSGLRELELSLAPLQISLAALLALTWILVQSLLWRRVLGAVDASTTRRHAIAQVWLPNLGKYVPGKIWAAVGRVYLCNLSGIPVTQGSVGLAVENVCYILGGAIFAAITLPLAALLEREAMTERALILPVLGVVAVGLVAVHPRIWGGAARLILRRLGREPLEPRIGYGRSLALVMGYVLSWSVLGAGMWAWCTGIVPLDPALGLRVVGLYVVAWSLGYLSMIAPAGIGVREGIMMAGLAGHLPPEAAVAIALGLRVLFTGIDLAGALVGLAAAPELAGRLAALEGDG